MKKNTIPSACRPYSKFATGTCQWQIAFLSSCLIIVFFCKLLLTVPGSFLNYNTTTHNKQGMDGVVWMHNTACMLSLYVIHFKIFLEFEIERIAPQSIEWLTEYPLSFLFFFFEISIFKTNISLKYNFPPYLKCVQCAVCTKYIRIVICNNMSELKMVRNFE